MFPKITGFPLLVLPLSLATMMPSLEASPAEMDRSGGSIRIYIGTYTWKASQGIYLTSLDPKTGLLSKPELVGKATNPSFLAAHPEGTFLYAVGEIGNFEGRKTGAVSAFSVEQESGRLTLLNQKPSGGGGPCHLTVDPGGKHVLVANYSGGNVSVLRILDDGSLGEMTAFAQHEGSGVHPTRQKGPHAHCINLDPTGHYALSADLGLDKVLVYRFDAARGALDENQVPAFRLKPGAGPRHLAWAPAGQRLYVINELDNTVTACDWDSREGALEELQTVSTLPADFEGKNTTAEVVVSPCGRFLYGSNRGHDSIAVFAIDPDRGTLKAVERESTGGRTPRNFALTPEGRFLLAANQDSDSVVVFRVEPKTGELEPTGSETKVSLPVCLLPFETGAESGSAPGQAPTVVGPDTR